MPPQAVLEVTADARARAWLDAHQATQPRVVSYDVKRCCGGGRLCTVNVKAQAPRKGEYVRAVLDDGTPLLVDRRAAARLPASFRLTVRGIGPLRHLDLDLDGDQWGRLLYD